MQNLLINESYSSVSSYCFIVAVRGLFCVFLFLIPNIGTYPTENTAHLPSRRLTLSKGEAWKSGR